MLKIRTENTCMHIQYAYGRTCILWRWWQHGNGCQGPTCIRKQSWTAKEPCVCVCGGGWILDILCIVDIWSLSFRRGRVHKEERHRTSWAHRQAVHVDQKTRVPTTVQACNHVWKQTPSITSTDLLFEYRLKCLRTAFSVDGDGDQMHDTKQRTKLHGGPWWKTSNNQTSI